MIATTPRFLPTTALGAFGFARWRRSLILLFGVLGLLSSPPAPANIVASAWKYGSGASRDQDEGAAVAFAQAADDSGSAHAEGYSTGVMYLYAGSREPGADWSGDILFQDTFRLSGVPFGLVSIRAFFSVSGELEAQRMASATPAGQALVTAGIFSPKVAPGVWHSEFSAAVTAPDALFGTNRKQINELLSLPLNVLSNQPFDVSFRLTVEARNNDGRAGFTNSGRVFFELPAGATITSTGGYHQTAPVPLPAGLVLLGSALMGVSPVAWRRRKASLSRSSAR